MQNTVTVLAAGLWLMALVVSGEWLGEPATLCIFASMFGGTTTQLLTYDGRQGVTRKVLIGEFMASGFLGFVVYSRLTVMPPEPTAYVAAVLAGGGGSVLYHMLVKGFTAKFGGGNG